RRGLFLPHELPRVMDADLARQGLRRLKLMRRLEAHLRPDPGSDVGRVCALESGRDMKNQLLRAADWAGMATGVEIRTPLVAIGLLEAFSPVMPRRRPGQGKAALARAPSAPLPTEVESRAKRGFATPTDFWTGAADGPQSAARARVPKGVASRLWARQVLGRF